MFDTDSDLAVPNDNVNLVYKRTLACNIAILDIVHIRHVNVMCCHDLYLVLRQKPLLLQFLLMGGVRKPGHLLRPHCAKQVPFHVTVFVPSLSWELVVSCFVASFSTR